MKKNRMVYSVKKGCVVFPKVYSFSFYELRVVKSIKGTLVIDYTFSIFSTGTSSYESNKKELRETDGTERVD